MSNLRLKDHTWDAANVYDSSLGKTQDQINAEVGTSLAGKQATLVSGENIKTVNGASILGSGNIEIQGGGGSSVVVDDTLSIAGAAADAKKTGDELDGLKSAVTLYTGNDEIEFVKDKYIVTSDGTVDLSSLVNSAMGYGYAVVDCAEGDKFTVTSSGGQNPRAWCFVNDSESQTAAIPLTRSGSGVSVTNLVITAPKNATKLVINAKYATEKSYYGEFIKNQVDDLKSVVFDKSYSEANTVTFTDSDGGHTISSLKVNIPLSQPGSGIPAMDNVRPIITYDYATIFQSGVDTTNPERTDVYFGKRLTNGVVDVVNKIQLLNMRVFTFDGVDTKVTTKGSGNNYYLSATSIYDFGKTSTGWVNAEELYAAGCTCSHFTAFGGSGEVPEGGAFGLYINVTSGYKQPRIWPPSSANVTDVASCNAWLKSLYDNGTPLQIAYPFPSHAYSELIDADDVTFKTLSGVNNIWSSQGDVSLALEGIQGIAERLNKEVAELPETVLKDRFFDRSKLYQVQIERFCDLCIGEKTENFIFFTDSHIMGATGYKDTMASALKQIGEVYDKTPTSYCIFGGDAITSTSNASNITKQLAFRYLVQQQNASEAVFGADAYYPLVGNHDYNYYQTETSELLTDQDIVNACFRRWGKAYYSFDGFCTKVYCLNTGLNRVNGSGSYDVPMDNYKWEQIDWLAQSLLEDDPEHSIIAMHIIKNNSTLAFFSLYTNANSLCVAYNAHTTITLNGKTYDFSECTGKVELFIGGHLHTDTYYGITDGIPYVIRTTALNTVTPTFDLVACDWDGRTATFIRCGTGSDLTINLDTGEAIT